MNTLLEDLVEVDGERAKRWVRNTRRDQGIDRDEPSVWVAHVEQAFKGHDDSLLVGMGRSPGDVVHTAELYAEARHAARRLGVGTWILEVDGSEGVGPRYLRVRPRPDEATSS